MKIKDKIATLYNYLEFTTCIIKDGIIILIEENMRKISYEEANRRLSSLLSLHNDNEKEIMELKKDLELLKQYLNIELVKTPDKYNKRTSGCHH